jgi:uncharacterized protein YjiS (DUF1127 family)
MAAIQKRLAAIRNAIRRAAERARSRRLLAQLGEREVRDFGISLSEARTEASKPFWKL